LGPTMLLGVWVSGGLFMTISALVSGSDFIGGTGPLCPRDLGLWMRE
jgi:hypothetical protein